MNHLLMRRFLVSIFVLSALAGFGVARGDDLGQARVHAQKALAAYALGRYAQAASEYEQSFALHADPALLYDAAQSQRLAGNKPRALLLYKNYLRLFENVPNRAEVERHISELEQAIESEKKAVTAPPTEPMSAEKTTAAPAAAPVSVTASPAPAATRADLTARAPERKRMKPWVWGVIGGAAAVALAVGLGVGLGLSQSPIDPTPSIGRAMVH